MKLKAIRELKGRIICETGLHIGGSTEEIEIGGVDSPIIKHPVTREPYIPGSSLKGKMRSQLEKRYEKYSNNGIEPCNCGDKNCLVCRVFGAHKNPKHSLGPTRLLIRDASLSEETRKEYNQLIEDKGQPYIEKKTENIINRKSGTSDRPRIQERVPAGAKFDFQLAIQIFDIDERIEDKIMEFIKEGLLLVEKTYLGGYGSRGSGKVRFIDLTLDGKPFSLV